MSFCKFSKFLFRNNLHRQVVSKAEIASMTRPYRKTTIHTTEVDCPIGVSVYCSKHPPSILLSTLKIIHQFAKDFKENGIAIRLFGFRFLSFLEGSRDSEIAPTVKRSRFNPDAMFAEYQSHRLVFHETLADTSDGIRAFELKDYDGYVLCFGKPL